MDDVTTKDIWVFGDLRNQRLFGFSLNVLAKARELSRSVGGKAAVVIFGPSENESEEISTQSSLIPVNIAGKEFVAHGADQVYVIETRDFIGPGCETYARSLADLVRERLPMLVLFVSDGFWAGNGCYDGPDLQGRVDCGLCGSAGRGKWNYRSMSCLGRRDSG